MSVPVPVIYLLDDNGEAFDVLWFCCTACRDMHQCDCRQGEGLNPDWIPGTVCEQCGNEIERGPRCADCNQLLEDTFHTGVFFHTSPCSKA